MRLSIGSSIRAQAEKSFSYVPSHQVDDSREARPMKMALFIIDYAGVTPVTANNSAEESS